MTQAVAERTAMAKKKAGPKPEKTLKCSEATWKAVSDVAQLLGIDKAEYVDQVLLPIAEQRRKELARKLLGKDA